MELACEGLTGTGHPIAIYCSLKTVNLGTLIKENILNVFFLGGAFSRELRFQEDSPLPALRWGLGLDLWAVPSHLDELGTVCVALNYIWSGVVATRSLRYCGNMFSNHSKPK